MGSKTYLKINTFVNCYTALKAYLRLYNTIISMYFAIFYSMNILGNVFYYESAIFYGDYKYNLISHFLSSNHYKIIFKDPNNHL